MFKLGQDLAYYEVTSLESTRRNMMHAGCTPRVTNHKGNIDQVPTNPKVNFEGFYKVNFGFGPII
jgi:hypothetical protein